MFNDVLELAPIAKAPPVAPTLVDAPATCEKCGALFYSPTTGRAQSPCWCGGKLRTLAYPTLDQETTAMNKVRAKFRCDEITRSMTTRDSGRKDPGGRAVYEPAEIRTVKLAPVYGNGNPNHENTKFWNASPSGRIELGCVNLAAAEQFEIGQEYYIDFTPANAPAEVTSG